MTRTALFCLLAAMMLLTACRKSPQGKLRPDMTPSFSITDRNPLGMYVAYHAVTSTFAGYTPEQNKKPFDSYFKTFTEYDASRKGNVFCVFARQFLPNDEDVDAIADYVSNGNTLIVASNIFSDEFLQKFHLRTDRTFSVQEQLAFSSDMVETSVALHDSTLSNRHPYHYFFFPLEGQVFRQESYPSQRISNNTASRSGGVVFKFGSGRIIVVANATAFTNYFMLTRDNYEYLQHLLSYVPETINDITWDIYYNRTETKRRNRDNDDGSFSAFSELMKQESMRWAFYLTLLLAATWIINGIIRRQRVIEVVKPNTNTSVEFAQTIGRLYLLRKDNKNIAQKMITYFLEQVRSNYYISTGRLDDRFVELLSAKSGQPVTKTQDLLKTFNRVSKRDNIDDIELLELNTQLKEFLK